MLLAAAPSSHTLIVSAAIASAEQPEDGESQVLSAGLPQPLFPIKNTSKSPKQQPVPMASSLPLKKKKYYYRLTPQPSNKKHLMAPHAVLAEGCSLVHTLHLPSPAGPPAPTSRPRAPRT